ncbi:hypothetical protein F5884DRAFT_311362 [Xylogone sp. PMI_703]|nr:hypothetical protein F5884DRAFT_311362 [Xylogone sp. PMI_703]
MGTVSMIPAVEGPMLKLSRAMTHPSHQPKEGDKKRRIKKGEPFDPEELSRRLEAYLAEQKKQAERRRRAREAAAANNAAQNQSNKGAYIPRVAAAAFARTATPDAMRAVHKLSKPALQQHMEVPSLDDNSTPNHHPVTNLQKTQAQDQAAVEKQLLSNRNQFQWTQDMEEAAEVDADRDVYKPPQRTFETDFSYLKSFQRATSGAPRPLSTGNVMWEEDADSDNSKTNNNNNNGSTSSNGKPRHKHLDMKDMKGRNDWAQEDEPNTSDSKRTVRALVSPLIRRRDSIWILKGRKEKEKPARTTVEKEEAPPPPPPPQQQQQQQDGSSTKLGRAGPLGFFTRFKRHTN